ncbi:Acylphosphatase [Stutzerimonas stutzeri]|nr:Acylphosphatase [Stutzerimonas stutzeri]
MTKKFLVFGRVQGVGFRYFTWQEAKKLGLKGSVRNRIDGSVEVIAQGDETQMADFEEWLNKGPKTAKVERVLVFEQEEIKMSSFSIVRR